MGAQAADAAAKAGPNYWLAGGLAAAGLGAGVGGALMARSSAKGQRADIAAQAAAARKRVKGEVGRAREEALSQTARGASAHGLLDSGLQARSQSFDNARADKVLGEQLTLIEQEKMRLMSQIPSDREIWAGLLGSVAGTALQTGASVLAPGYGNAAAALAQPLVQHGVNRAAGV